MAGDEALRRISDLPFTFFPGLLKREYLHRIVAILEKLRISSDALHGFLTGGAPPAGCSPAALLMAAAAWNLPCVRFGKSMPGAAAREQQATEAALEFIKAALQHLSGEGDRWVRAKVHHLAAEILIALGHGQQVSDHLTRMLEEGADDADVVYLLRSALPLPDPPQHTLSLWCKVLSSAAYTQSCDEVAEIWRTSLEDILRRHILSMGLPMWRLYTTPLGHAVASTQVLPHTSPFPEAKESIWCDLQKGSSYELAVAALSGAWQGLLTGWVGIPSDGCLLEGGGALHTLCRAMEHPPSREDLEVLRGAEWPSPDGSEDGPAAVVAIPLQERIREYVGWCSIVLGHAVACDNRVTDATSCKVARFYNENPYPVWSNVGFSRSMRYDSYHDYLTSYLPPSLHHLCNACSPEKVLIAGCGSGHQVALGLCQYRTPVFEGVDLSQVNLNYASAKLERLYPKERHRWTLRTADILRLEEKEAYDIIECTGVLHHCSDPKEALSSLASTLKPGGVLFLGVYAAGATERVRWCSDWIHEKYSVPEGTQPDLDLLREVRGDVLALPESNRVKTILTSQLSFNSAPSLRDMLFHPCVHYFSVKMLKEMVEATLLELLAFQFESPAKDIRARIAYSTLSPDPEMRDWSTWATLEEDRKLSQEGLPWHSVILYKPK